MSAINSYKKLMIDLFAMNNLTVFRVKDNYIVLGSFWTILIIL